jgi:hypothetical protein
MKKMKINKITLGIILTFGGMYSQAQIPVTDGALIGVATAASTANVGAIGSAATAAATAAQLQRQTTASAAYAANTNAESIMAGNSIMMASASQNVVNTDYRNRIAAGMQSIAKEDDMRRPTLQNCIEASKSENWGTYIGNSISTGRSSGGTTGRPKGQPAANTDYTSNKPPSDIQNKLQNESNRQTLVLANLVANGTCDPRYGKAGNCPGGTTTSEFSLGDVSSLSLMANIAKSEKLNTSADIANYSINPKGVQVAKQYINVSTLGQAPNFPNTTDLEKNPGYVAMYNNIIIKLNAAGQVLNDILSFRIASPTSISSILWTNAQAEYSKLFPTLKFPTNPSWYDILNYRVHEELYGKESVDLNAKGVEDVQKDIAHKLAENNYISWKAYNQQEQTNILLSHILVQLTTPTHREVVDQEYSKMVSGQ